MTTTKATTAPAKKTGTARGPRLQPVSTFSDHEPETQHLRAIHHGNATVPYGPCGKTDRMGWHYPGGEFTQSIDVARHWAAQLDRVITSQQ